MCVCVKRWIVLKSDYTPTDLFTRHSSFCFSLQEEEEKKKGEGKTKAERGLDGGRRKSAQQVTWLSSDWILCHGSLLLMIYDDITTLLPSPFCTAELPISRRPCDHHPSTPPTNKILIRWMAIDSCINLHWQSIVSANLKKKKKISRINWNWVYVLSCVLPIGFSGTSCPFGKPKKNHKDFTKKERHIRCSKYKNKTKDSKWQFSSWLLSYTEHAGCSAFALPE